MRLRGCPVPPATQKGKPRSAIFSRSASSLSPYTGSPRSVWRLSPRGGALWPPAVGPSTTKPSTRPFPFLAIIEARVWEETMGRNLGRFRGVAFSSQ